MRTSSWISLFIIVLAAPFCLAQSSVEGVVKTAAGAPVSPPRFSHISLTHAGASAPAQKTVADAEGRFHFAVVEGGQYMVRTEASGFFTSDYQLVLRPREPVSLTIELAPKTTVQESVEVRAQSPDHRPRQDRQLADVYPPAAGASARSAGGNHQQPGLQPDAGRKPEP